MKAIDPTLEELCARRPRLLRAEVVHARTPLLTRSFREIVLSFDSVRLRIDLAEDSEELACSVGGSPAGDDAENANESEPWWRVLGNPLIAAWAIVSPDEASPELTLQFREDDRNPRLISLTRHGGEIRVRCESLEDWKKRLAGVTPASPSH